MARVRQRKRDMVDGLIAVHLERYKASGAGLIMGAGRFVAPKTLEVRLNGGGTRVLVGERVFLSVGTHATIPNIPGLEAAGSLTHVEVLELDRFPAHLIVPGGGYVSLECAQAYRRFGSRVTVVEHGPQVAGREELDVADAILQVFRTEGIDVVLSAEQPSPRQTLLGKSSPSGVPSDVTTDGVKARPSGRAAAGACLAARPRARQ
jgi:pyruvate/2-oxoglutarate dehydrogenase complex dihydrolipoamide dehydrogenase (E3) component